MTTKQAIAAFFLQNNTARNTKQVSNRVSSKTGTTAKTVRNVIGLMVSSGALRKTSNGYSVRNKRALSKLSN